MNKKGVTLTEILIVMAILIVLIAAAIGAINPIGIFNRARDAQRKKDLNRIKISFEDYFNDKGCYPNKVMVDALINRINCGGRVFSPWLVPWPCDPDGSPYPIVAGDDDNCPKWYKVMTNLENPNDSQISYPGPSTLGSGATVPVNYSVSGGNAAKKKKVLGSTCWEGGCYYITTSCNWVIGCVGDNCYSGRCVDECKIECCGVGCE